MKQLLFLFLIIILASIFTYSVPVVHARGGCERTGIITGTITFVDLVCDTILFVPRLVFTSLLGSGHGYRSRHDRHDSFHYRDGTAKKKRGGRKGRGRR